MPLGREPRRSLWPEKSLWHSHGEQCESVCWSEKLEKAGTVDFEKHPARKVGTRSRQCGPEVPGRFAFLGAPNPRIWSIWRFGKKFPAIFPEFSRDFPPELPQRPQKQPQPSRVLWAERVASTTGWAPDLAPSESWWFEDICVLGELWLHII